jgi:hypothetical protein
LNEDSYGRFQGNIRALENRKITKTGFRIVGNSDKIRVEYLPITSIERYQYTVKLSILVLLACHEIADGLLLSKMNIPTQQFVNENVNE